MNFNPCISFTLHEERGYQNLPADAGNWSSGLRGVGSLIGTCWGISAPTLIAWMGHEGYQVTDDFMASLDQATAKAIYASNYWNPIRGSELPAGADLMVFDFAVTSGVRSSARLLQIALGTEVDGYIGPRTLQQINQGGLTTIDLIHRLAAMQEAAYRAMRGAPDFLHGWLNRLQRREAAARLMLPGAHV